jgi:hypothetical protein
MLKEIVGIVVMVAVQAPTPYELVLTTLLVVSVFALAYLFKKYNDLARQVIDEKLLVLGFVIPTLEQIIPLLPDKYKEQATLILDLLKDMKTINEALKQVSPLRWHGLWKEYRKTLLYKYKLKQGLMR